MKRKNHERKMSRGIFIILLSMFSISVMAQQKTVSGKVTDAHLHFMVDMKNGYH